MRGDPAMECWNYAEDPPNLHTKLLPLALFSLVCYPFGWGLVHACHVNQRLFNPRLLT